MQNNNQYVLITGATSGIGYQLAKLFARDKYNLVLVARDPVELDKVAAQLTDGKIKIITMARDLFVREQAFLLYEEIKKRNLEIIILVNNAGQGLYGKFKETDIYRELDIINLNISSLIILTKCFLKDMVKRKNGKILNLASIASKIPGPWQSVYHATKAFVLSFSEAIREECKEDGITVTALMPGATNTDFFHKADMEKSKIVQDKDKLLDPADVAKDGYDALMAGKDKVVSGLKNKIRASYLNLVPDAILAHNTYERQKPK
ncbi:MAG TPA: SDR family oxidoreductase [Saprospiraceae bacterium]|nr:SDR family oxidoreductase [Saprospiraceae bacterium]